MKATEFIKKLQEIVDKHKTLYVMGCFGAPLTGANVTRYCTNHKYNTQAARTAMIKAAANKTPPVFGFDCVCLIKGVLWGWNGDASKTYGGAGYAVNGVPDIGADSMIQVCKAVSTDFTNILPGEAVWMSGHIGVYIGNGKVIECTPAFKNCVQVTACWNIGKISGMNGRKWTKHGKLPYITYDTDSGTSTAKKPVNEIAAEVIKGLWGNGDERKQRLTAAGYNYTEVQAAVNAILKGSNSAPSNIAPATATADPKGLWNGLIAFIGNPFGVAGLMGNIYAESGLVPNNLQNSGNTKTGMTDAEYTAAVDSGKYTNFVKDCHGFGLCQWTYWTRKQALLDFAKAQKASIGNQAMQIAFIKKELSEGYSAVLNTLKNAKSVREASDAVLCKFERPADQSAKVQECRAAYGQKYFDTYAGTSTPPSGTSNPSSGTSNPSGGTTAKEVKAADPAHSFLKSLAGTYTVRANGGLNIRTGAGTNKKILVTAPDGTKVQNYGYYTNNGGVKWLYVQFTLKGVNYTGFASSQYLKK